MNEEQRYVTQFTGTDGRVYIVRDPNVEAGCIAGKYVYVNDSHNLEVSSDPDKPETPVELADDAKLNLVAKTDIQVKPGTSGTVEFDCEKSSSVAKDAYEIPFKVCNGSLPKATRVVGTKWNTAQWIFDTQKVNSTPGEGGYDPKNFIMQWRLDKWNSGVPADEKGPIEVKLKAKSFDIRCHGHGGVALQPAGADSQGHENKIKFESSRTSAIDITPKTWGNEGGKGLEFGTFNNDHSSLFTGTYRFRGISSVYPSVRLNPVVDGDKTDYPTQPDDFKDVIPLNADFASWADVVNVVRYIKSLPDYLSWRTNNKLVFPAGTLSTAYEGWDDSNMQVGFTTHKVYFSCEHGSVTAKVDNVPITSGADVVRGKSVVFTITPAEGYEYIGTNPETVQVVDQDISKTYECTLKPLVTFSCTNGSVGATVDGVGIQSPTRVNTGKSVIFTITPDSGYEYTGTNPETVVVNADVTKSYECFPAWSGLKATPTGTCTIYHSAQGRLSNLQYSTDGENWDDVSSDPTNPTEFSETIYLCGENNNGFCTYDGADPVGSRIHFGGSGTVVISGHLGSLINPLDFPDTLPVSGESNNACFTNIFRASDTNSNTNITSAENLILPAPTAANVYAYQSAFQGCTALTKAPTIPGDNLFESAYPSMFCSCSSLVEVHCNATTKTDQYTTNYWLDEASPTGDFYGKSAYGWATGPSGIPSGWTRHLD